MINKFKLAFICPTAFIEKYGTKGEFTLALSHLLNREEENDYERTIKKIGLPIVCDNGLFENGVPEGIDSLITKALRIKARLFFAPDHLYNAVETRKAFEITKDILKKRQVSLGLAVVIQAETIEEYIEEYKWYCQQPEVVLIGLSILAIPRCFGRWNRSSRSKSDKYTLDINEITSSRIECLKKLKELDIKHKFCHLLGLGNSMEDVLYAAENCPFVISNDTSSAFQNGLYMRRIEGENLEVRGGKVEAKVDFDRKEINSAQQLIIEKNIETILKRFKKI